MFCVWYARAGHIPGRPQGGRHGMVFGLRPPLTSSCIGTATATSAPLVPGSLLGVVLILVRPVKLYVIIFISIKLHSDRFCEQVQAFVCLPCIALLWFAAVLYDIFFHGVGIVLCMKLLHYQRSWSLWFGNRMLVIVVSCFYKSFVNILQDLVVNLDSQICICLGDFQRIYNFSNQTSFVLKVKWMLELMVKPLSITNAMWVLAMKTFVACALLLLRRSLFCSS